MATPLGKGIDATGKIKIFQIGISIIMCLDIPLAALICKLGANCYNVMFISIMTSFFALIYRLIVLSKRIEIITISSYMKSVVIPCLITIVIDAALAYYISTVLSDSLFIYIVYISVVCILSIITIYFICLENSEKEKLNNMIKKVLCHI